MCFEREFGDIGFKLRLEVDGPLERLFLDFDEKNYYACLKEPSLMMEKVVTS